jgi:hypothetical protein
MTIDKEGRGGPERAFLEFRHTVNNNNSSSSSSKENKCCQGSTIRG